MRTESFEMVRIYLTESEHHAQQILELLKDADIRGATLLRGISGFGQSGVLHRADWVDLAGDLPLVIEFADRRDVVEQVLPRVMPLTKDGHVLRWSVQAVQA